MNCQDFAKIVSDLARERLMEASVRAEALAHTGACARCERRFADERSLTQGLRALAATAESAQAPAHIEAALLAAFREQQQAADSRQQSVSSNHQIAFSPPPSALRPPPSRWPWWAAAAAILLLFALAASRLMNASPVVKKDEAINLPTPSVTPTSIQPDDVPRRQLQPDGVRPQPVNVPAPQLVVNRPGSRRRPVQRRSPVNKESGNDNSQMPAETEVLSDFIPLASGLNQTPIESGHLVRVSMPRSALTTFGLPMNIDRANESIKADVLIGDDGVARAIRFANYVPGRRPR